MSRDGRGTAIGAIALATLMSGCSQGEARETPPPADGIAVAEADFCALPATAAEVLVDRPSAAEDPVDDVNWFARPVLHDGDEHIVAFASHDQNYLYDLTRGARVAIPDRSDAVATPDGRFMTVPSTYTPDSTVRFYAMPPLLEALEAGRDATDVEPVFAHEHPSMRGVYYQSTGVVSSERVAEGLAVHYRLMFSGGHDESNFRIADYHFTLDPSDDSVTDIRVSGPMALCPEVRNDLNTPFISKDGRYVAAYTSDSAERGYTPGASLKIFEIESVDPEAATTSCREVVDFGFAAGKADFSFDGSLLTFHISRGQYLTPFVNGGLPEGTTTDVVVARLERDASGAIVGAGPLTRLTTSTTSGVGSYFPAFLPDGNVFYVANAVPRESDDPKRFHLRVIDPDPTRWLDNVFATDAARAGWETIAGMWERACVPEALPDARLAAHEAPWLAMSMTEGQCQALVEAAEDGDEPDGDLARLCSELTP